MTDLLLKPEDTGEIPAVDPGPDTRNLAPYATVGPFLRKGELTEAVPYAPQTIGVVGFDTDPRIPYPDPLPPPPPPTPRIDDRPLSVGEEVAWTWRRPERKPLGWFERLRYRGEHRAAGR